MSPPGVSHVNGTAAPRDAAVWNWSEARLVLASVSLPACRGSSDGDDAKGGCAGRLNLAEHLGTERCLQANGSSISITPYRPLDAPETNYQNYVNFTKEVIPGAGYPQVERAWNGTAECKETARMSLKPVSETQDSNLVRLDANSSVMQLKGVPNNVHTKCPMHVNNGEEDAPAVGHLQLDSRLLTMEHSCGRSQLSAGSLNTTDLTNLGNLQCESLCVESRWLLRVPDEDCRRRLSQHFEATLWLSKLAYDMMRAACRATLMQSGASADSWSKVHSEDDIICNEDLEISHLDVLLLLLSWWKPTHKVTASRSTFYHIKYELYEFYVLLRDVKMQRTYFGDITTVELVHLAKQLRVYEAAKGTDVHFRAIAAWQLMREKFEGGCVFTTIQREDVDIGILRGNPFETTSVHCFQLGCEPPTEVEVLAYENYRKYHQGKAQTLKPPLVFDEMRSHSVQPNGYIMQGFHSHWEAYFEDLDHNFSTIHYQNAAVMIRYLAADIRRAACRATLILHGVPPMTWLRVYCERDLSVSKELNRYLPEVRRLLLSWWAPGTNSDAPTESDFGDGLEELLFFCDYWEPDEYFPNLSSSTLLRLAKGLKARGVVDSLRRFYKLFAAWQLMREHVENGSDFQAISRADKVIGILYGKNCIPRSHLDFCEFNGDDRLVPTPSEIAKYECYKAAHFRQAHTLLDPKNENCSFVTLDHSFTEDDENIQKIRCDHFRRVDLHKKAEYILADLSRDLVRAACRATLMLHGVKPEKWSKIVTLRQIKLSKKFKIYLPEVWRLFLSWWSPSTDASTTDFETLEHEDGLFLRRISCHMDVEDSTYYADFTTEDLLCVAKQLYYNDTNEGMRECYRLFAAWQLMRWQFEEGHAFKAIQYSDVILGILRGYLCKPVTAADRFTSARVTLTETEVAAYNAYKRNHFAEYEAMSFADAQLQLVNSKVLMSATSLGVLSDDSEETARLCVERVDSTNDALVSSSQHTRVLGTAMVPGRISDMVETGSQMFIINEKDGLPAAGNLQILKSNFDMHMLLCNRGHGTSQTGGKRKSEGKGKPTYEEQHSRQGTQLLLIDKGRYMYRPKGSRKKHNVSKHECRLRKEFAPDPPKGCRKKQNVGKRSCRLKKEAELTPLVFTKTPVEARGTEKITRHETNSHSIHANDGGNLLLKFCTLI